MPDALTVLPPRDALRRAIDAATRPPESACVAALLAAATLAPPRHAAAQDLARRLIGELRATRSKAGGVDALMREFSLSSEEGVALMCLAEALLRIPDQATADALIRDKLARGNWRAHVGSSPSLFVNAAAWGLLVTGKIVATHSEEGLGSALTRLLARGGEPLIRKGVDLAMRLLGRQFVTGETIGEALDRAREHEARGYRYSYDMLGEAALTDADARRYLAAYEGAIAAIGAASGGRGIVAGPGISVKLSALHPRYSLAQRERVLAELLPRLRALCLQAKSYDIGLNIDAEESERLGLSLDLVEQLLADPALAGWEGLGVVVQAYQKRCPFVIDWLLAAARQAGRRIMVRLVKGAYWDSEVKRAQVEGQADYPVFTRKVHTDVSYLACARKLLAATDVVFPQFATHNALTLAAIVQMADEARAGAWEFQCLHGMGESLYDQVVPEDKLGIPCRIYAPVGSHETLLAYLVRRLLENGANSSFVNRIVDPNVGIDELLADPVAAAQTTGGTPHPRIPLPADLYAPVRRNSAGLDLNDETTLAALHASFTRQARREWRATPQLAQDTPAGEGWRELRNPARHAEVVGRVLDASPADVEAALAAAASGAAQWAAVPAERRAAILDAIAAGLEQERDALMWLAMHEAGKTLGNALGEVREAVDFCRYYAAEARAEGFDGRGAPLGVVACISPWNFPLAIFTGEVVAALAAGNAVLAKPAEQTPLIAALAVQLMHAAGVPRAALQLLPGDGRVGAQLVADTRVAGVVFTGSTEVAQKIDQALAARCERSVAAGKAAQDAAGAAAQDPVLVAETGGQNAMIVDSSALPEQVVTDVLASAFDSAGQRCSALRVLCLQEDIAERVLAMLHGAFAELRLDDPALLATDIGPVIDAEAQSGIEAHVAALARRRQLFTLPLAEAQRRDACFVAPAIVELGAIDELKREVFGPVLHVVRWRRSELAALVDAINATGYGLTLGIHSRIDETIDFIVARAAVGNVYVNRNVIGAVVGVQPFGGEGLSGTGPKAGGPWYLPRLRRDAPPAAPAGRAPAALDALCQWAKARGNAAIAALCARYASSTPLGAAVELPGPTGERNTLSWHPRGRALCLAADDTGLLAQLAAVLATGNVPVIANPPHFAALIAALPAAVRATLAEVGDWHQADVALVLHATDVPSYGAVRRHFAAREGARVRVVGPQAADPANRGAPTYALPWLLAERVVSVNTAAAGGNASLMTLGVA